MKPESAPIVEGQDVEWRNMTVQLATYRPWGMIPTVVFVDSIIGIPSNETIRGLMRRIRADPSVCSILSDALEEAGCEDRALLEALRTA